MGSTKSHWVQLPLPNTYKGKYLKLKELIYADLEMHKDSQVYRRAYEVLQSLVMCIEHMEEETKK